VGRTAAACCVALVERGCGGGLKSLDICVDARVGGQHEHTVFVHDAALVREREPGEVQSLTEVRA